MIDDLSDDLEAETLGPALIMQAPVGDFELHALEELFRKGSPKTGGASLVIFTHEDDAGLEFMDDLEATRWQKMMAWPVAPSVAEAMAFVDTLLAEMLVENWEFLKEARTLDEAVTAANLEQLFSRSTGQRGAAPVRPKPTAGRS